MNSASSIVGQMFLPLLAVLAAVGCNGPGRAFAPSPTGADEDVWAIRCLTLTGSNRFETMRSYEQALKKVRGIRPDAVAVLHDEESSVLYFGRYARRDDLTPGKESYRPDPLPDLELIRQLAVRIDGNDVWPFRLAVLDALPTGPVGDPAWELSRAAGFWSLQVGVFYNTQGLRQRKHAAVEYCKLLREQGEEAYYHHGPVNSSVCIGAFPETAIADIKREDPLSGVLTFTSTIVDERMLALQRKYPYNLENGHKVYEIERDASGKVAQRTPIPSFPVRIPRSSQRTTGSLGG